MGAASAAPRGALASDPQEQQLAQALFDDGRRLMDAKRYSEACPKLAESQRLDPGGGTLLNLAICHEGEGKLATAKNDFDEALAVAVRDGRRDRQTIARQRIAAIEAAVPRVTVLVAPASDIDGLVVKLDGLALRRAAWGVATPVDPGSHLVEATATGRAPWSSTVEIDATQKKTVGVPVLGPLAPLPLGAGGVAGGFGAPSDGVAIGGGVGIQRPMIVTDGQPSEPPLAWSPRPPAPLNPVFYTVLVTTLVLAGTSAVTGIMALSADKDAKVGCVADRGYCRDQASMDAADSAQTLAWVSTITLSAAAAGFVALLVLPSRKIAPRSSVRGTATVLPGGGSLGLAGAF